MENKKIILQLVMIFLLVIVFVPNIVDAHDCNSECKSDGYIGGACKGGASGCNSEECIYRWHDDGGWNNCGTGVCCCYKYYASGSSCTSDKTCYTTANGNWSCYYTKCDGSGSCSNGWHCDWCCNGKKSRNCSGGVCTGTGTCVKGYCFAECAVNNDCPGADNKCDLDTCTCGDPQPTCFDDDPPTQKEGKAYYNPKLYGTCSDGIDHTDYCTGDTLTEWYCFGGSCASETKNCDDYDCTENLTCTGSGTATLKEIGSDYRCGSGICHHFGDTKTCHTYICSSSRECNMVNCAGTTYWCVYKDGYKWLSSKPSTETGYCEDDHDNDCDNTCDATGCSGMPADPDCVNCSNYTTAGACDDDSACAWCPNNKNLHYPRSSTDGDCIKIDKKVCDYTSDCKGLADECLGSPGRLRDYSSSYCASDCSGCRGYTDACVYGQCSATCDASHSCAGGYVCDLSNTCICTECDKTFCEVKSMTCPASVDAGAEFDISFDYEPGITSISYEESYSSCYPEGFTCRYPSVHCPDDYTSSNYQEVSCVQGDFCGTATNRRYIITGTATWDCDKILPNVRKITSPWGEEFSDGSSKTPCVVYPETVTLMMPDSVEPGIYTYEASCDYSYRTCDIEVVDNTPPEPLSINIFAPQCFCPSSDCSFCTGGCNHGEGCEADTCCISPYEYADWDDYLVECRDCQEYPKIYWTTGATDVDRFDVCYIEGTDYNNCLDIAATAEVNDKCFEQSEENPGSVWKEVKRNIDPDDTLIDNFVPSGGFTTNKVYIFQVRVKDTSGNKGWNSVYPGMKVVNECSTPTSTGFYHSGSEITSPITMDLSSPKTIDFTVPVGGTVTAAPIELTGGYGGDYSGVCANHHIPSGTGVTPNNVCNWLGKGDCVEASGRICVYKLSNCSGSSFCGGFFGGCSGYINTGSTYESVEVDNLVCSISNGNPVITAPTDLNIKVGTKEVYKYGGKFAYEYKNTYGSTPTLFSQEGTATNGTNIIFNPGGFLKDAKMRFKRTGPITTYNRGSFDGGHGYKISGDRESYYLGGQSEQEEHRHRIYIDGPPGGVYYTDWNTWSHSHPVEEEPMDPVTRMWCYWYGYAGEHTESLTFDVKGTNYTFISSPGGFHEHMSIMWKYDPWPRKKYSAAFCKDDNWKNTGEQYYSGEHTHDFNIPPFNKCLSVSVDGQNYTAINSSGTILGTIADGSKDWIEVDLPDMENQNYSLDFYGVGISALTGSSVSSNFKWEIVGNLYSKYKMVPGEIDMSGKCAVQNILEGTFVTPNDVCHWLGKGDCVQASGSMWRYEGECTGTRYSSVSVSCNTSVYSWKDYKGVYVDGLVCSTEIPDFGQNIAFQVNGGIGGSGITFIGDGLEIPISEYKIMGDKETLSETFYTKDSTHNNYIKQAYVEFREGGTGLDDDYITISIDGEQIFSNQGKNNIDYGANTKHFFNPDKFSDGNVNVVLDTNYSRKNIYIGYTLSVPSRNLSVTVNGETKTAGLLKDGESVTYNLTSLTQGINHLDFSTVGPGSVLSSPHIIDGSVGSGKFNYIITGDLTQTIDLATEINEYVHENCPSGCDVPITFSGTGSTITFDTSGAAVFGADEQACNPFGTSPLADSLHSEPGCISPFYTFSWAFVDDTGDFQSQYQIQIDDNSGFTNCSDCSGPVEGVNGWCDNGWYNYTSTKIDIDPGTNSFSHPVIKAVPIASQYYWRLKVWDNTGMDSGWSDTEGHNLPIKLLYDEPKEPKNWLADILKAFYEFF